MTRSSPIDRDLYGSMNAEQLEHFRQRLLALREQILSKKPVEIEPNRGESSKAGANEDEQPLNEMLQAIASNRNRAAALELQKIGAALLRLRDEPEDFGYCQDCGDDIALKRLEAMPYAELCINCQSKQDGPRGGPTRRKLTDYR